MRSIMVSKGISKFITTFTGACPWRALACGCVRGNPSNNQGDPAIFLSSDDISSTIVSSGTRSPRSINCFAFRPTSVPCCKCCRRISPELTCFKPKSRTIQFEMVPFPDPGAPTIKAHIGCPPTVLACLIMLNRAPFITRLDNIALAGSNDIAVNGMVI